jgi:hypothetical protein
MVKGGIQPIRGGVALTAIGWEVRGYVVRIRRALKVFQVATHARGGGQVVVVVDVAVSAFPRRHGMATSQQESRRGVIEFRVQPVITRMTTLARGGELGVHVIGIGGRLKILEVARRARRGHGLKLAVRQAFVARVAVDGSMRTC